MTCLSRHKIDDPSAGATLRPNFPHRPVPSADSNRTCNNWALPMSVPVQRTSSAYISSGQRCAGRHAEAGKPASSRGILTRDALPKSINGLRFIDSDNQPTRARSDVNAGTADQSFPRCSNGRQKRKRLSSRLRSSVSWSPTGARRFWRSRKNTPEKLRLSRIAFTSACSTT